MVWLLSSLIIMRRAYLKKVYFGFKFLIIDIIHIRKIFDYMIDFLTYICASLYFLLFCSAFSVIKNVLLFLKMTGNISGQEFITHNKRNFPLFNLQVNLNSQNKFFYSIKDQHNEANIQS